MTIKHKNIKKDRKVKNANQIGIVAKDLPGRPKHRHGSREAQPKDPSDMPTTFKFAAQALQTMSERGGSPGSIVVGKYKNYNFKLIYALVMNTVKNIKVIKKLIYNLKLINTLSIDNPFLLEILVGDLLHGKGLKSVEKNAVAAALIERKPAILKEQASLKKEFHSDCDLSEVAKYLRINHLKSDMNHVLVQLRSVGLTQIEYGKIKFKKFINKFKTMDSNQFMLDFHFPDDLIIVKLDAVDKIKKLDLIRMNKVTLQDKASFMAVEALDLCPSQKIIDACFAPGCKTSLIATKLKNKGKILAFDVDKKRLVGALRLLKLQGATCVRAELRDFSKVKLTRLPKINNIDKFDAILIDPSCSGSGIKTRVEYKKTSEEPGRLKKLQAFQVSLLKHALKACVSDKIVYCTCSTSIEENEQVVEMALNESGVKDRWEIVEALPYWPERGDQSFEFGTKCIRSGSANLTNGFFICKLRCNQLNLTQDKEVVVSKRKRKSGKEKGEIVNDVDEDDDMDGESSSTKDDEEELEEEEVEEESSDQEEEEESEDESLEDASD